MKKTEVFYLAIFLLLVLRSGAISGDPFLPPGICEDTYTLLPDPDKRCEESKCERLCQSKNFFRLLASRCVEDNACKCTHACRSKPLL